MDFSTCAGTGDEGRKAAFNSKNRGTELLKTELQKFP
jgi:hypothetical protein